MCNFKYKKVQEARYVHSGLMKYHGEKYYHPYLSDDTTNDQMFVHCALKNMFSTVDIEPGSVVVIELDNCRLQYKSPPHFDDIQEFSNILAYKSMGKVK